MKGSKWKEEDQSILERILEDRGLEFEIIGRWERKWKKNYLNNFFEIEWNDKKNRVMNLYKLKVAGKWVEG